MLVPYLAPQSLEAILENKMFNFLYHLVTARWARWIRCARLNYLVFHHLT